MYFADKPPPIVAFADNLWHGPWMNRQQLLSRLAARGWPVVYSNGAFSLWDRGTARWAAAGWHGRFETADGVVLHRAGRWPPRWQRFAFWDRLAIRSVARRLAGSAGQGRAGAAGDRPLALIFHPRFLPYVAPLGAAKVVFYAYDALALTPGWSAADDEALLRTVQRADLVIASSAAIARSLPSGGRGEPRVLPNGADAAAFQAGGDAPCPPDLAAVPRPRIGYVGNISRKVDLTTVAAVAEARPSWHWVMVGNPVAIDDDPESHPAYVQCRALPNVHFLGNKHHAALPAYVNHMDVNTMCYRQKGGWWEAIYPLKLHEYLAAGKPVISADIEAVREFDNVVDIAASPQEWVQAIERALTTGGRGSPGRRRAVAFDNTWDSRVDRLEGWLTEIATP